MQLEDVSIKTYLCVESIELYHSRRMLCSCQRIHSRAMVLPPGTDQTQNCIRALLAWLAYSLQHSSHLFTLLTFFSGPFNCIGKQLALMELRTVVSLLVSRFDVHLAPGEDGSALIKGSKDAFTLRMGDLRLVFKERVNGKIFC